MSIRIHVIPAPADMFFVNAFLIEAPDAVILVDTHFLLSSARTLDARIDALGKPLAAILITHPHPDHYNGLPTILAGRPPLPVYANQATLDGIKASRAEKRRVWTPVYGEDYPTTDATPDHILPGEAVLHLAGVELRIADLGPGECADNSIIHLPQADALIASDLIYNRGHPWLAEHRTAAWLAQLDRVAAQFAGVGRVYAGHGPEGDAMLFETQRRYITDFRARVTRHARAGALDDAGRAAILSETVAGREGWPLEALIPMNADAVAQELAA
jgi:glyoxylase-like metal-dependent hydrolase (beta-lactamase superfamily II)